MSELGSVFEHDDEPRGLDLRVTVEVPRAALGSSFRAPVPERLAADGELVERVVLGDDEPGFLELHLPASLPDRAALRLRGQGGPAGPGQRAGDLLVVVELVDRPVRDGERITRSAVESSSLGFGDRTDRGPTNDVTLWILAGLVLLGGGVIVTVFLL